MGINIPTGKAKLSSYERNARMDEDMVRFAEFGEGWNFTPGIAVTRRIGGDKDLLTLEQTTQSEVLMILPVISMMTNSILVMNGKSIYAGSTLKKNAAGR